MNVASWIDSHARFVPEKVALSCPGREYTYHNLALEVALVSGLLVSHLKIKPGDRIAYLGYNTPELVILLLACARTGAILLPLNWRLTPSEHRFILQDCLPSALFVDEAFTPQVGDNSKDYTTTKRYSYADNDDRFESVNRLLTEADPVEGSGSKAGYDSLLLLCYTSGTTGKPKGTLLDQKALLTNALNSIDMHDLSSGDRVLSTLPLFHVGGLNIQTLPALYVGATVILHPVFDPQQTLRALQEEEINLVVLVPAQLHALLKSPDFNKIDRSALRSITTGSTMIPLPLIESVHQYGIKLIQVYGSTETAPIATYLKAAQAITHAGSAGQPALHCELRIVNSDFEDLKPGESGEILVRGENVMRGYWNAPETTAEVMREGWFCSGDIGHQDEDGNLYIDGRSKELIISGGENIYPAEVENILAQHPSIIEASVVGRADQRWGEVPVAVIVSTDASLTHDEIYSLFEGRLAKFKHPAELVFVDSLPRNAMGKIEKEKIKKMISEPD
ncbi:MAG: feruloyl-CoA synthetase [Acidiferrobacteraceae bacterium]|jgi:fatty-acyl-CoA synthase|nr:feruloyl-CoA synthetase [Acidiferrobacteraceae bacterium]MDP6434925.1 AMP-binding protein [Arenicellales bacterium]MDP6673152.1 AMP-binding protein [Arenicellales bacterium]MDP6724759.1 AMP-binding protein [Arenicellales bacterium]|tara:strand:+ start:11986 stop:13503 length:1518 start_codon:yes stop_codon:yes gene_type:complete